MEVREKLQEISSVAEILSALAVVASLIFVGLEIRQSAEETELNTRAIQNGAYQNLVNQLTELTDLQINNPEYYEIENRMTQGGSLANENERRIYHAHIRLVSQIADMAHYQFLSGLLEKEQLYRMIGPLRVHLETSQYARDFWNENRAMTNLSPAFREYVELMMREQGMEI